MPVAGSGEAERLGPYRLLNLLGEGAQGRVFLGEDPDGRRVAVKLLRAGMGDSPEGRARFMREFETAKQVAQFCTAAVLDADVAGDQPYIVSEYVNGPSLLDVVRNEGPRTGGALERLAIGTATALVSIHGAGVVHRDFKPHNVLLGPDGPRVIDFGIARVLDGGTITSSGVIGTPSYMAPEQMMGKRTGPASDVFAWASTMVFAATGRPPFGDDTVTAVAERILHNEPDLSALTGDLRDVVARCLAKDPELRPSASAALRLLLGEGDSPPSAVRAGGTMPEDAAVPAGVAMAVPGGLDTVGAAVPGVPGVAGTVGGAPVAGPATDDVPPPNATMRPPASHHPSPPSAGRRRRGAKTALLALGTAAVVATATTIGVLALIDKYDIATRTQATSPPSVAPPQAGQQQIPGAQRKPPLPSNVPSSSPTPSKRTPSSRPTSRRPSPIQRSGIPASHAGTWSGQVEQNDGQQLMVNLTLPLGKKQGTVRYPDQDCAGVVTLTNTAGKSITLREQITQGAENCIDTGTTTLTKQSDGTLFLSYVGTEKGQTYTVRGPISRQG